eukprot:COSAG01_NODE_615_length_14818_cov_9.454039_2_plen_94_part_00
MITIERRRRGSADVRGIRGVAYHPGRPQRQQLVGRRGGLLAAGWACRTVAAWSAAYALHILPRGVAGGAADAWWATAAAMHCHALRVSSLTHR